MSVSWVRSRCKPTDQPKETLMYPDPATSPAVMASPVVLPLHIEFEEERLTSGGRVCRPGGSAARPAPAALPAQPGVMRTPRTTNIQEGDPKRSPLEFDNLHACRSDWSSKVRSEQFRIRKFSCDTRPTPWGRSRGRPERFTEALAGRTRP